MSFSMPRSRNIKGGLYELRFKCQDVERRISYTFSSHRHIITLTTFRKQRNNVRHEVARPRRVEDMEKRLRTLEEIHAERIASMTDADKADFDVAYAVAGIGIDLSQMFYDVRTDHGLTQAELAKRMHTTQPAIARIENGGVNPGLDMLERLAESTGMRVRVSLEPLAKEAIA